MLDYQRVPVVVALVLGVITIQLHLQTGWLGAHLAESVKVGWVKVAILGVDQS